MISGVLGHTEKNKKNICSTIRIQEQSRNSLDIGRGRQDVIFSFRVPTTSDI